MQERFHYLIFFKPYGVLSQFRDRARRKTLSDFGPFPERVYAAGRLDMDSEGLLFLTDDADVNHRITDPKFHHLKTYLCQVEHIPNEEALARFRDGLMIEGRRTKRAEISLLADEPSLPPRDPPIRFRKDIPTPWLKITLSEGRNRQIRRMTAAIGHPTLRLVRIQIANLSLGKLSAGESRLLEPDELSGLRMLLRVQGDRYA